jgi:hypothetical protein
MHAPKTPHLVAMVAAATFAVATPAFAQPQLPAPASPEVIQKVYACAGMTDDTARLACFDAAVGALKTAETQGQFTAVDAAGVRQLEREAFGFSLPSLPRLTLPSFGRSGGGGGVAAPAADTSTAELDLTISRRGSLDGRPTFVMSNGQVWALVGSEDNRLARAGANVTIRRAAVGSYLMSVPAGGTSLRVRRAE